MEFTQKLLNKLSNQQTSLSIIHLNIENWILFQRNTFDYLDDTGDPYICQIFLIEISTGRYIHRSQGQNVDHGTTLDLDILASKLTQVFLGTKPCHGFPVQKDPSVSNSLVILDYPFQRFASKDCQFYCNTPETKPESNEGCIQPFSRCLACQDIFDHESLASFDTHDFLKMDEESLAKSMIDLGEEDEDIWLNQKVMVMDSEKSTITNKRQRKGAKLKGSHQEYLKEFKCKCCSKTFSTQSELTCHARKRKQEERAKLKVGCRECDQSDIVTFAQLARHVAKNHPNLLETYQVFFPKEENLNVMKEPMKCSVCDMTNNGSALSHRHREIYHDLGDYSCRECQEPCLTYYDLIVHNYQKHGKTTDHIAPSSTSLKTIVHNDGKIEYKKSKITCQVCLKTYSGSLGFVAHMRTKHSWGIFNCKPCGGSCHFAKDISAHVLNFHKDNPEIECPNCQKKICLTKDPSTFVVHFQKCAPVPADKGPFQCQFCGKEYTCKISLDAHIKMHQGIIKFKCQYCDFGSNHRNVWVTHEKMHLRKLGLSEESEDDKQTHQCDICGKQLANRLQVNQHIRSMHKGYKRTFQCKKCGEFFKYSAALYKHKKEKHGYVPKSVKPI